LKNTGCGKHAWVTVGAGKRGFGQLSACTGAAKRGKGKMGTCTFPWVTRKKGEGGGKRGSLERKMTGGKEKKGL